MKDAATTMQLCKKTLMKGIQDTGSKRHQMQLVTIYGLITGCHIRRRSLLWRRLVVAGPEDPVVAH